MEGKKEGHLLSVLVSWSATKFSLVNRSPATTGGQLARADTIGKADLDVVDGVIHKFP